MSAFSSKMMDLGPVCWWRLGEASGTVVADSGSSSSSGSYINSPRLGQTGAVASDPNTAVRFDASSSKRADVPTIMLNPSLVQTIVLLASIRFFSHPARRVGPTTGAQRTTALHGLQR